MDTALTTIDASRGRAKRATSASSRGFSGVDANVDAGPTVFKRDVDDADVDGTDFHR